MNLAQLILQSNLPVHELTEEQSKTLKAAFVQMYLDILAVCEKHHLTLMMGGGSCLGTIRHKGFIPWDDDIDLNMMRKDYVPLLCSRNTEINTTVWEQIFPKMQKFLS